MWAMSSHHSGLDLRQLAPCHNVSKRTVLYSYISYSRDLKTNTRSEEREEEDPRQFDKALEYKTNTVHNLFKTKVSRLIR